MKKRKLLEMEKDGSFVAGIECDLSLLLELVNKQCGDGEVIYEPEFGMLFRNRYMHKCFIRARDIHKCSLDRLYIFQSMYVHRLRTTSPIMPAEKEFARLVEAEIR